jgi:hypothetical protein
MAKRIAVLVRERHEEGLRVAVGLTLADNAVEVYVLECGAARTRTAEGYLEALRELQAPILTTCGAGAGLGQVTVADLAGRLLRCDHILAY